MRYFILAGEPSGDLHGAGLVDALKAGDDQAVISGWGGDRMEAAGAVILKHYRELAFMGFVEVVRNLPAIIRNFRHAKAQISDFRPDAIVFIDYPGFNLRMARWAADQQIPVHYYISPQLWAWKEGRVEQIRKYVDHMYVILPFEKAFYDRYQIEVEYVGHPLLEVIEGFESTGDGIPADCIALLAGSRAQEIKHSLPVMLRAAERFPERSFCVAGAPHVPASLYQRHLEKAGLDNVRLLHNRTYDLLRHARAAVTTSGTATLETALFGVPQVVCYKGNALSFQIAKRLVRVPYISLVNLIANAPVVEELIQENFNPARVAQAIDRLLDGPDRTLMEQQYSTLRDTLDRGGASRRVANLINQSLHQHHGTV